MLRTSAAPEPHAVGIVIALYFGPRGVLRPHRSGPGSAGVAQAQTLTESGVEESSTGPMISRIWGQHVRRDGDIAKWYRCDMEFCRPRKV